MILQSNKPHLLLTMETNKDKPEIVLHMSTDMLKQKNDILKGLFLVSQQMNRDVFAKDSDKLSILMNTTLLYSYKGIRGMCKTVLKNGYFIEKLFPGIGKVLYQPEMEIKFRFYRTLNKPCSLFEMLLDIVGQLEKFYYKNVTDAGNCFISLYVHLCLVLDAKSAIKKNNLHRDRIFIDMHKNVHIVSFNTFF